MNGGARQLERVFLANVLMYLETTENVEKFSLINSKCKDSIEVLRINPGLVSQETKTHPERITSTAFLFMKELEFFPNLETIKLTFFNPFILHCIPSSVKRICIQKEIDEDQIQCILPLKDKIIELRLFSYDSPVDLEQFPNLRKIYLRTYCSNSNPNDYLEKFFTSKIHRFDLIYLKMVKFFEGHFIVHLNEYSVKLAVIELNQLDLIKQVLDISVTSVRDIRVCCKNWIEGLDPRVVVMDNKWKYCKNNNILNQSIKERCISSLVVNENDIVLSQFEYLHSLECLECVNEANHMPKGIEVIELNGSKLNGIHKLTKLKEIHLINAPTLCISSTCSKLVIKDCKFHEIEANNEIPLKELIITKSTLFDINVFKTVTYLELKGVALRKFDGLTELKRLVLDSCTAEENEIFMLPNPLTEVEINSMSEESLDCSSLTNVKKMTCISIFRNRRNLCPTRSELSTAFWHPFQALEELHCDVTTLHMSVEKIKSPIRKLRIEGESYSYRTREELTDLRKFNTLEEVWIECSDWAFILPETIKKLMMRGCLNVRISNLKEIEIKEVFIEGSSSIIENINSCVERLYVDSYNKGIDEKIIKKFPKVKLLW